MRAVMPLMVPGGIASGCYEIRSIPGCAENRLCDIARLQFLHRRREGLFDFLAADIGFPADIVPGAPARGQRQAAQFQGIEFLQHLVLHGHIRLRLKAEQFPASPEAGTELSV